MAKSYLKKRNLISMVLGIDRGMINSKKIFFSALFTLIYEPETNKQEERERKVTRHIGNGNRTKEE